MVVVAGGATVVDGTNVVVGDGTVVVGGGGGDVVVGDVTMVVVAAVNPLEVVVVASLSDGDGAGLVPVEDVLPVAAVSPSSAAGEDSEVILV